MRIRILLLLYPLGGAIKKYHAFFQRNPKPLLTKSFNFIVFNFFILWSFVAFVSYHQNSKIIMAVAANQDTKEDPQTNTLLGQSSFFIPEDIRKRINRHRMILVMDLDETMVFTRRKRPPQHSNYVTLNINDNLIYVEFRPHIAEFLAAVSQLFTIYVYTAGSQPYADAVLDSLPNKDVISKRFYRQSCIYHKGRLIKDLKVIHSTFQEEQQQKLAVLVDDNRLSISYNHPHSVRIGAFEGNQEDKYLHEIFAKLMDYYRDYSSTPQE